MAAVANQAPSASAASHQRDLRPEAGEGRQAGGREGDGEEGRREDRLRRVEPASASASERAPWRTIRPTRRKSAVIVTMEWTA